MKSETSWIAAKGVTIRKRQHLTEQRLLTRTEEFDSLKIQIGEANDCRRRKSNELTSGTIEGHNWWHSLFSSSDIWDGFQVEI